MSETTNLKLFKHNEPLETNENQFDVDLALNQNWDKIDDAYGNLNTDIENLQINDNKQDELISKLKSVALNAETEESKSLHVTDANKFGQLEVLGNYEQETREGYNLLQNKLTNTTINGVTFKINEDKSVTVNGTATASIIANLTTGKFEDGDGNITNFTIPNDVSTLKLSGCPSGGSGSTYKLDLWNSRGVLEGTDYGEGTNISISSDNDRELNRARIIIYAGATVNNLTFKPMLVAGTEEKEYEQYGASPSSEYSSPVVCLGSNKNLYDGTNKNYYINISANSCGISEGNTGSIVDVKGKSNVTISSSIAQTKFRAGCINSEVTGNTAVTLYNGLNKDNSIEMTINCEEYNYLVINATDLSKIKVEEGTEATSYSPYNQGSTKISKINKNLFDKNNANILKAYIGQISKKITAGTYHRTIFLKVNSGDTYTIKKYVGNGLIVGQLKELPKIEDVVDNFISTESETPSITTKISDGYNYLVAYVVNNEDNTEDEILNSIQTEKGNVATDYIEHQQTDYILNIQQEMLKGDYFVKEADGWKEVHSYPKKIFDGTEAWNLESLSQGNNFYTNIPDALEDTTAPVYSNCFMYYNGLLDKNYSCRISGSKNLNLRCNEKNTAEEFKQMLADKYNAGNPVYAFYKSATPTKLPCTEEQSAVLEELNNMDLFEGVNNIITTEDIALLKLKYALDVKTYVNNQLANVNAQTLNIAGGN